MFLKPFRERSRRTTTLWIRRKLYEEASICLFWILAAFLKTKWRTLLSKMSHTMGWSSLKFLVWIFSELKKEFDSKFQLYPNKAALLTGRKHALTFPNYFIKSWFLKKSLRKEIIVLVNRVKTIIIWISVFIEKTCRFLLYRKDIQDISTMSSFFVPLRTHISNILLNV